MALSKDEMEEMLGRLIPADLPLDPETSYRPSGIVRVAEHLAATQQGQRAGVEHLPQLDVAPPASPSQTSGAKPAETPAGAAAHRERMSGTQVRARSLSHWVLDAAMSEADSAAADAQRDSESMQPIPGADTRPVPTTAVAPAYALLRPVGEGGFGEVWEAVQSSLGRVVAVKRLRAGLLAEAEENGVRAEDMELLFRREALTTALLEHPNIVPVHDLGMDAQGRPVLAMKLVRGERWDQKIHKDKHLELDAFLARHLPILIDVTQAVGFAHARGIVHRDLKPSQVMVGEFGEVLLMDWGISMLYDPAVAAASPHTPIGELVPTRDHARNPAGTPAYMAREQTLFTAEEVGPWTDIYLLGGMLYYLLTLHAPHSAANSQESFALAIKGNVVAPEVDAPARGIAPELSAICMKALARDPNARHATARAFLEALQDFQTGAGKRREAARMIEEVRTRLATHPTRYDDLTALNNLVIQANALWPGHPETDVLKTRVLVRFAEAALANNDLVLARLMAEGIDHPPARTEQLAKVVGRERRRVRDRRNEFILRLMLALLLVIIIVEFFLFAPDWVWQWWRGESRTPATARVVVDPGMLRQLQAGLPTADPAAADAMLRVIVARAAANDSATSEAVARLHEVLPPGHAWHETINEAHTRRPAAP